MHHAWFVARFLSGYEEAAARGLDLGKVGARGFCPLETRRWEHRGKHLERRVAVLAGYVFVEMARFDAYRWHDAAGQPGFLGFIGGELPQPVLDGRVEDMLIRSDYEWTLSLEPLKEQVSEIERGDRVLVIEGLLSNLIGHVEWIRRHPDYGLVVQCTLTGLFAGEIRAELPIQQLEKVKRLDKRERTLSILDLPIIRPVLIPEATL